MLTEPNSQRRRVSTTGAPADRMTRHRRASSQLLDYTAERDGNAGQLPGSDAQAAKVAARVLSEPIQAEEVDDLTKSMSALQFIPSSVRRQNAKKG